MLMLAYLEILAFFLGLLNIFNAKLGSMQNSARVRVSIRLNYALTDWVHLFWSQKPPSLEFFLESEDLSLPFGCRDDPISELSLGAVWPSMVEDTVIESEHYSDFDPLYAPEWRVSVQMAEMTSGLMTLYLESLLQSCSDRRAYASFGGAFDRLTEPIPSLSSVLETTGDNFKKSAFFPLGNWNEAILPSDLILKMISMLFDDSESKTVKLRGCKTAPQDSLLWRLALVFSHALASLGGPPGAAQLWHAFIVQLRVCWDNSQLLPGLMLGPPNLAHCLLYQKLQMLNCCIEQRINRTKGLVTKEFETDSSKDMDGEDEFFECEENLNVEEVSAKEEFRHAPWNQPTGRLRKYENFLLLHSDEPLYIPITQEPSPVTEDILEQQAEILLRLGSDATGAEQRAKMQSACLLSDMESFKLIFKCNIILKCKAANPNAALEDFVRWYSPKDWILEPGEPEWSKKGVILLIKLIRWASNLKKKFFLGQLSVRMNIPGNQWQSLWASSKPVPARRQRRLFDETREAEKVFHYLSTLNSDLGSVASLLLSTVLHCAIVKLLDEKKKVKIKIPVVDALLANAINRFVPASRASQVDPVVYEEIINDVRNVEFIMSKAVSLQKKFLEDLGEISEDEGEDPADEGAYDSQASDEDASEDDGINQELVRPESREIIDFVSQLMTGSEVEVSDGPSGRVGCVIKSFFSSAYKNDDDIAGSYDMKPVDEVTKQKFPLPITKEYIFRVQASRPTPYSAPTPQRMYACVSDSEIRIAASFTQDTLWRNSGFWVGEQPPFRPCWSPPELALPISTELALPIYTPAYPEALM
ncbi:unnamed protein product [Notodromas monacha]|uniref:Rab3 GTPase-activating protein catalytic subunit n=1 Tax=Notodromas monacha TaxID=399045 RepID=A0A7R9G8T5_9CRUS|nr:unnamed protein product [Notodromas monacha]CAG0913610.1 unnamed protein product [Notodromas monacha]